MTLLDAMNEATRAGFTVFYSSETETRGWWVSAPKRPRVPAAEHGVFKSETRAWFAACSMARDAET